MIKAIIIDDESSSRSSLKQKLLAWCPDVEVIGEAKNGEEGIQLIESLHPDLLFLDVEMPRMNGFGMLQQLTFRNFDIIFTTAFDQYAIQAIRVSALDYLVKPIEVEELKNAVDAVKQKRTSQQPNARIENLLQNLLSVNDSIAIPSREGLQFINVGRIIYLEAESNYTVIYMDDAPKLTVTKTLKEFEELLSPQLFIRIHHSYLINKKHIRKYIRGDGGQVVMSNNAVLYVSKRKKTEFLKAIGY